MNHARNLPAPLTQRIPAPTANELRTTSQDLQLLHDIRHYPPGAVPLARKMLRTHGVAPTIVAFVLGVSPWQLFTKCATVQDRDVILGKLAGNP